MGEDEPCTPHVHTYIKYGEHSINQLGNQLGHVHIMRNSISATSIRYGGVACSPLPRH